MFTPASQWSRWAGSCPTLLGWARFPSFGMNWCEIGNTFDWLLGWRRWHLRRSDYLSHTRLAWSISSAHPLTWAIIVYAYSHLKCLPTCLLGRMQICSAFDWVVSECYASWVWRIPLLLPCAVALASKKLNRYQLPSCRPKAANFLLSVCWRILVC